MRFITTSLLVSLLTFTGVHADEGTELLDPATGATLTLPEGWQFAGQGARLLAFSPDREAMILLVEAGEDFEEEAMRVDAELREHIFRDVVVTEANILYGADRGALAGAIASRGTAVHRSDDRSVDFFSLLIKDAEGNGGLIVGAWKDPKYQEVVQGVVNSVQVRQPGMEKGLELRDKRTGARVRIPDGWAVFASRHGLITFEPERRALAIMMSREENYREVASMIRKILRERLFDEIEISEFSGAVGISADAAGEVMRATGTAKDRADGEAVEFIAVVGHRVDEDSGVLVVGSWKDPEAKKTVEQMLATLRFKE